MKKFLISVILMMTVFTMTAQSLVFSKARVLDFNSAIDDYNWSSVQFTDENSFLILNPNNVEGTMKLIGQDGTEFTIHTITNKVEKTSDSGRRMWTMDGYISNAPIFMIFFEKSDRQLYEMRMTIGNQLFQFVE